MPTFIYSARNAKGKIVKGTLESATLERAKNLLRNNKLTPVKISSSRWRSLLNMNIMRRSASAKELVLFSRQLSSMIAAGVPILESLRALITETSNASFRTTLESVAYDIEGGASLSQALSKHPEAFNLFFQGIVRTGEASGRLAESLGIMADYLESNYVFSRKVRSALVYPIFVIVSVIIVVILMFVFVVPQLIVLFEEASVQLPWPTRLLISTVDFVQSFWIAMIGLAVAIFFLGRSYLRTPDGQYALSAFALYLPGLKNIVSKIYLARMTSVLHTLFSSDVPVIESLSIAKDSLGNRVYQNVLSKTTQAIKDGANISAVWEQEPLIPNMLTTMVAVGERSGNIDKTFGEAYRFFRRDVDEILATLTTFIEPLLVIILAIGVAIIVAAILLPIYNLVLVL